MQLDDDIRDLLEHTGVSPIPPGALWAVARAAATGKTPRERREILERLLPNWTGTTRVWTDLEPLATDMRKLRAERQALRDKPVLPAYARWPAIQAARIRKLLTEALIAENNRGQRGPTMTEFDVQVGRSCVVQQGIRPCRIEVKSTWLMNVYRRFGGATIQGRVILDAALVAAEIAEERACRVMYLHDGRHHYEAVEGFVYELLGTGWRFTRARVVAVRPQVQR